MRIIRIVISGMAVFCIAGWAQTVRALITNPDMFDEKTVIVEGELIGDIFKGRSGFWVNMLDSGMAIGVWFHDSEKEKIKFLGKYGVVGDFVRITGVFHKRCIQHSGDMDIHASTLEILKRGTEKKEEIPVEKVIFAFSLGVVSLAAIGILHLLSRKESLPHNR
ncbi:MAG: DNA-binding protein [bacterium]|nr:DNA-binding protein [bacterium]